MVNQDQRRVIMYHAVGAFTVEQFNLIVQRHLNEGWQLWGSPFSCSQQPVEGLETTPRESPCLTQAMVKYERKER